MTRKTVTKKKRSGRRPVPKKRKTTSRFMFPVGRIVCFFVLFLLLFFSVGMLGYVVFFRTVIAAESPGSGWHVVYEERSQPEIESNRVEEGKNAAVQSRNLVSVPVF
ncbi:MAG: hypothetical protein CR981_04175 [Proteobacteria bacterium]|nr:MAG: hypothetical protein CR981_04175 [Pseudomonadota bacterium]